MASPRLRDGLKVSIGEALRLAIRYERFSNGTICKIYLQNCLTNSPRQKHQVWVVVVHNERSGHDMTLSRHAEHTLAIGAYKRSPELPVRRRRSSFR
jgi:hypothetical protein